MATKKVFQDETCVNENRELEVFINSDERLYIGCGILDDNYYSSYITLSKEDTRDLIKELQRLYKEF